jgi:hypothetical protein
MINLTVAVKTVKNDIADLSKRAQAKTSRIMFEDSQVTLADAKARSRVDTGEMRDGWTAYMIDRFTYELKNDVPWTKYNEYGTVHMSAQPMAQPATEAARQRLPRALSEAFTP